MRRIWIGTSGYTYPHWRRGVFYPPGLRVDQELAWYARSFRTVELNNPFYRLPSREVFAAWCARVPEDFRFAVKVSRYLTHLKHLRDCAEPLQNFLNQAEGLAPAQRGPLLFQLPPRWKPDFARLRNFLPLLPQDWRCAFEFRHPDWWQEPTWQLLERFGIALCLPVSPFLPPPPERVTARFAYLRLHGGTGPSGNFTEPELRHWAAFAERLLRHADEVWIYFNNDQEGYAARNALRLMDLLAQRPQSETVA